MFRPPYDPAMATYVDRLRRSPAGFRALTGLTPDKFDGLLAELEPRYAAAEAARLARPGRKRKAGAGPKFALPLGDRLLTLLAYYRAYVSQAFLGFLFAVDDATVCRNIAALQPLLANIFRVPERRVDDLGEDEVRELFVDATEQPTDRPKRGQRDYYSGKKKRHTVKHQVVVVRKRKRPGRRKAGAPPERRRVRVAAVSPAHGGRTHDKAVYDATRSTWPPGVPRAGDSGYQGVKGMRPPHKKPKGGELTPRRKAHNRRLSRRRVAAEHGIGKMKVWRIVSDRYRGPRRRHTPVFKNVAGLHNLMFA